MNTNERASFSLIDMIRALRGFRSPEGYVVIPNDVAEKIEAEIERLYSVEEAAIVLANYVVENPETVLTRGDNLIVPILGPTRHLQSEDG